MEEKTYIERKDGIKYYKNCNYNTNNYNSHINIRVSKEMVDKLKEIASDNNIKYQKLVRDILEQYVKDVEV